jgi:hypothetical protein
VAYGPAAFLVYDLETFWMHVESIFVDIPLLRYKLGNYTLGASYCRRSTKKGGVCIYVHCDLHYSKIDLGKFSIDQHTEATAILLSNFYDNIYIISIYRAPSGNFTLFYLN